MSNSFRLWHPLGWHEDFDRQSFLEIHQWKEPLVIDPALDNGHPLIFETWWNRIFQEMKQRCAHCIGCSAFVKKIK